MSKQANHTLHFCSLCIKSSYLGALLLKTDLRQKTTDRRRDRRKQGENVTKSSEWTAIERKPLGFQTRWKSRGLLCSSQDRLTKKRQPCGCLLWWARRDLKASYVNRFTQSIDHKADLPYPKNRPLIDLAAKTHNRKYYSKSSLISSINMTKK